MSDVKYSVEVEFLTKGNLGKSLGLGGATSSLAASAGAAGDQAASRWERSFNKTFGSMKSGVEGIASMLSMDAAFGAMAVAGKGAIDVIKFGIINMNAEIEEMRIGLGTIFTANGVTDNLTAGMGMASTMMKQMRKDAAVLPGTFNDLATIFQTILAPALNSGMSPERIREMATHAMSYGTAIGLRAPVIGRELAAMLSGQARGQNILAQRLPGMQLHGDAAKKFNAMSTQTDAAGTRKHVAKLEQALGMRGGREGAAALEANAAYEKAWVGTISTLKDAFKKFAGEATEPLFEKLKGGFTWLTAWMKTNETHISMWAMNIGLGLEHGFDMAKKAAERLLPVLTKAADLVQARYHGGHLKSDASIVTAGLIGVGVASKLAGPAMGVAGGLVSTLAKVGASQPEVALAAVVAMTAALVPLSVIAFATGGAFNALTDNLSFYHTKALAVVGSLRNSFAEAERLSINIWKQIEEPLTNLSNLLGITLLETLDLAGKGLVFFLQGLEHFANKAMAYGEVFGLTGRLKPTTTRPMLSFTREHGEEANFGTRVPEVHNHTTNIGHIEIKVISNQDPNRIAKKTFDIMKDAARNPTSTPTQTSQYYRPGAI